MKITIKIIILVSICLLLLESTFGLDKSTKIIGSDVINELGIDGRDNTICIIDSGIDYTHANLGNCENISDCVKILGGYDFHDNDDDPIDLTGHGTKVAGIIMSNHSEYSGVAPGINFVILRALNSTGGSWNALNKSIAWCVDNKDSYNITTISMSLGDSNPHTSVTCNDFADIQDKINEGVANGISFIAASGNEGFTTGINYPACLPNVTSVGSITNRIEVAAHSNRFSNLDLLAPGVGIKTTKLGGGLSAGKIKDFICGFSDPIGGDFWTYCDDMAGTSFATPHVSGAFALLKQFDTALKPYDIEKILKETGDNVSNFKKINLLNAFGVLDWPTFHHDNRRTGFTLLKGDMEDADDAEEFNIFLHDEVTSDTIPRISLADLDNNGDMDIVVGASKSASDGWLYRLEYKDRWWKKPSLEKRGIVTIGRSIPTPPSLGDTYGDDDKEVFIGLKNATLMAFDSDLNHKWSYVSDEKDAMFGNIGYTAISDIDNDGKNEIIFTDSEYTYDFKGTLHVLEDDGTSYSVDDLINQSHGGAWGAVSLANIDSDDYLEIIVPTYFGIYVYDFDGSTLTEKWSNTDSRLDGAVVIYDIDKDGKYEIIYNTHTYNCNPSVSCYRRIYIRDAETGNNEGGSPITLDVWNETIVTPALGDIDGDGNAEILVTSLDSFDSDTGRILCFEYDGTVCNGDWPWAEQYPAISKISPDIVDIDGDNEYEVIISERGLNEYIWVINGDGNHQFHFELDGEIGSAPAIGDINGNGLADIAVKRAGSPLSIVTVLKDHNSQPELNTISNITAIAGELIDINTSGEVSADDEDNGNLNFFYSSPFNESGLWQTTINDTGNYSILVEVSDGNLLDYKYVDLIVFNESTVRINTFSDSSNNKTLNFTQSENKTVTIKIPKASKVVYTELVFEGGTS